MNLIITEQGARHQASDRVNRLANYLPHEDEPVDFYRKYTDDGYLPRSGRSNLQNLFDDTDVKDYYWFNVARKYLSRL